ncbi:hypothetical protein HS088_TW09G00204 [Tripterygium wilfordii]|uniref:Ankyrin repeat family protein n=1 Tax=Tripterygium wilfordii TaxID=458696 RepID=A0A7J7D760_TRIWF|nr:hypothetical protein HS088_TW09G00204 [Tripterygium wilfordii]
MAAEAPSWADQWGAGGIGVMDDDNTTTKQDSSTKKTDAKTGFGKAKAAASVGAQKIMSGASGSFKWVKNQCQKKGSSKSPSIK